MADPARITPVILCGGAGTRLWPLSRPGRPKHLLALAGSDTMLQATARRVADAARFTPPTVITAAQDADAVAHQLEEIGAPPGLLILEPVGRNTAPAIALAALAAAPNDLLLVMPSDHLIGDEAAFLAAVEAGAPAARDGRLVTFGTRPHRPATGYGYIRRGEAIAPGVHRAESFVEKPDFATAERYLSEGSWDWNGGIFLFRAGAMIEALGRHAADLLDGAREAMAGAKRDGIRLRPDANRFSALRAESIDRAVMERAEDVAVVPVDMGWSDIGSWDALFEVGGKDSAGNVLLGPVQAVDSAGCLLASEGPRLAALEVHDLIVVATPEFVLVLPRGASQRVREIASGLSESR